MIEREPIPRKQRRDSLLASTTHITAILDRSGSMQGLVPETIGSYNSWLKEVKKAAKGRDTSFTLLLFDDRHEYHAKEIPATRAKKLDNTTYFARGLTALYDALGGEILRLKQQVRPADKCIILVMTDGLENASQEISLSRLRELVRGAEQRINWSVTFIGANMDTMAVGREMGMGRFARINRTNDAVGTQSAFTVASNYTSGVLGNTRSVAAMPDQKEYNDAEADISLKIHLKKKALSDDKDDFEQPRPKNRIQGPDGKFITNKPKDNRPSGTRGPR